MAAYSHFPFLYHENIFFKKIQVCRLSSADTWHFNNCMLCKYILIQVFLHAMNFNQLIRSCSGLCLPSFRYNVLCSMCVCVWFFYKYSILLCVVFWFSWNSWMKLYLDIVSETCKNVHRAIEGSRFDSSVSPSNLNWLHKNFNFQYKKNLFQLSFWNHKHINSAREKSHNFSGCIIRKKGRIRQRGRVHTHKKNLIVFITRNP